MQILKQGPRNDLFSTEARYFAVMADSGGKEGSCPASKKECGQDYVFAHLLTRGSPFAPDTTPNELCPVGHFQWRRHHVSRGGRMPPKLRARGDIRVGRSRQKFEMFWFSHLFPCFWSCWFRICHAFLCAIPQRPCAFDLKMWLFLFYAVMGVDSCLRYKMIAYFVSMLAFLSHFPCHLPIFHSLFWSDAASSDFCSSWQCAFILHLIFCWIFA